MNKLITSFFTRLSVFFLLIPFVALSAGQEREDNLSVFNRLALNAAREILESVHLDSTNSVSIQPQNRKTDGNWLMESVLMQEFGRAGVNRIYLYNVVDSVQIDYRLEFQITKIQLNYEQGKKKDEITRKFELDVSARLIDLKSGLVKLRKSFNDGFEDSVRLAELDKLENKNFSFTHEIIPQKAGFKKYFEPALVIVTTISVIYLFFSLRSS